MTTQADQAQRFLALHRAGEPLLMPNPWDLGSARLLASLGFEALATTSSGFAATLGRTDGAVSRDEAIVHAAVIVAATDLPVSADLENGFADDPAGVAETMRMVDRGRAGGRSVEDFTGRRGRPHLRHRPGGRARRGRRRGRARGSRSPGADRPRRELPARPPRPGRHDRPAAGVPGGGRRRALRSRACAAWRTSARWSARSTGRSTSSPWRACRRSPSSPRPGSAASRWAARSRSPRSGRSSSAATELREQGTYGFRAGSAAGAAAARRAFG